MYFTRVTLFSFEGDVEELQFHVYTNTLHCILNTKNRLFFFPKLITYSHNFPSDCSLTQHPSKMLLSQWITIYLITNAGAYLRIQHPFNLKMHYYNDWIEAYYKDRGDSGKSPLSRKMKNNCNLSPNFTN